MVRSSLTPKKPIPVSFCGIDCQKFHFLLISDTLSVWGCKGSEAWKITTDDCRIIQVPEFSFILMFWKQIFFVRIMKYQVEFWHLLSWRLLRPAYVNFLKTGGWYSNVQISWSHWAPYFNKIIHLSISQIHLVSSISIRYTLYELNYSENMTISHNLQTQWNQASFLVESWFQEECEWAWLAKMYERRQSGDSLYCRYEVQHPQFYIQLVYKQHFEKNDFFCLGLFWHIRVKLFWVFQSYFLRVIFSTFKKKYYPH